MAMITATANSQQCVLPPITFSSTALLGTPLISGNPPTGNESLYAKDAAGNCVGEGTFPQGGGTTFFNVVVRGDDPNTSADEGLSEGETYFLELFDASGTEYSISQSFVFSNTNGAPAQYSHLTVYDFSATVLPIELDFFKATCEGSGTRLIWETTWEENVRGFEIQQASDGVSFKSIGWLDAQGVGTYRFEMDEEADGYFRLWMEDFDGSGVFSELRYCNNEENTVALFPNPVKDYIEVRIVGSFPTLTVSVFDVYGNRMLPKTILYEGNQIIQLPMGELPVGSYYLRIWNGREIQTMPFVKI